MKYIITESQINKIIYNYLNNKNFYHLDYDGNNYLVDRKTDDYAFVKFEPRYGWCDIAYELVKEVSTFFSIPFNNAFTIVADWVGTQIKGADFGSFDIRDKIKIGIN